MVFWFVTVVGIVQLVGNFAACDRDILSYSEIMQAATYCLCRVWTDTTEKHIVVFINTCFANWARLASVDHLFLCVIQVGPFSLRVVGVVGITYLLPQDERPLCHPTVERSVALSARRHNPQPQCFCVGEFSLMGAFFLFFFSFFFCKVQ